MTSERTPVTLLTVGSVSISEYDGFLYAVCSGCLSAKEEHYEFTRKSPTDPWTCRRCKGVVARKLGVACISILSVNSVIRYWVAHWTGIPEKEIEVEVNIDGTS